MDWSSSTIQIGFMQRTPVRAELVETLPVLQGFDKLSPQRQPPVSA